ncbi:PREDICTED: interferon-induced very large GTPase 1-like [Elephantulus edwardii]|uniref:interferon-induced very large GTPase 1-like n=1 Tax=Elephantulus edwardii TaxID=28737 RepID=UPI0003F0B183|nr:PREDICTED: interferon-induced very large GTPase 1-like [Elephantulus edwardii]
MNTEQSHQDEHLLQGKKRQDLKEMLKEMGLDTEYWLAQLQNELGVSSAQALQHLEEKDLLKLKAQTRHCWEIKALETLLTLSHSNSLSTLQESQQVHHKLQEQKDLKSERKQRQEAAVKTKEAEPGLAVETPKEHGLTPVKPVSEVKENMQRELKFKEGTVSHSKKFSDGNLVRWASGGLALQGIYKTRHQRDLIEKREELLSVPKAFKCFGPEHGTRMETEEFSSSQAESIFTQTIQKLGFSLTGSVKAEGWGFNMEAGRNHSQQAESREHQKSHTQHSYFCTTKFCYVPLASCHFPIDKLKFSKAALQELKCIEDLLGQCEGTDALPLLRNRTEAFFHRFGSHANKGPLHLGGIYWWKAVSEGFQREQLEEVKKQSAEALNFFIKGSYSGFGVNTGASVNISSANSKIFSESITFQNTQNKVQLSVAYTGGPPEADSLDQWKAGLSANNQTWCVIDRGLQLVPIWDIIFSERQLAFLREVSSLMVVLMSTTDSNNENRKIVRDLCQSSKPLICLLDDKEKIVVNKSSQKVRIGIKNRNEADLTQELTSTIRRLLQGSDTIRSLEDCAQVAREQGFLVDEDQKDCQEAKEKAQALNVLLGEMELSKMKENVLPLQGELWHLWCKKDKELYHLREKGNRSIEQHKSEIEAEKKRIRQQQLHKAFPLNDLVQSVLEILQKQSETHTKLYFIHWLSVFLSNLTMAHLEKLCEKQSSLWSLMETEKQKDPKSNWLKECQKQIEAIAREISDCSLGIEHILREVGQIYEALEEVSSTRDLLFLSLPQIAADLMISGAPIELMDGDASYVALKWVAAVFDKISEKIGNRKLFVLSILGLQSSGKSTLLNALFGLQFTVSAGRCTRGAYMQLLKVEDTFTEELGFDYMSHVLDLQNKLTNQIQNGKIETLTPSEVEVPVGEKYESIKQDLEKYFSEDPDSEVLIQWKANFKNKLIVLKETLITESKRKTNELLCLKKSQENLDEKKSSYLKELLEKSRNLALTVKGKELTEEELCKKFNQLWNKWVCDVASILPPAMEPDIEIDSENILLEYFKKEKNMVDEIKSHSGEKFQINYDRHIQMSNAYLGFRRPLEPHDTESIIMTTDHIYSRFTEIIDNIEKQKCDYNHNDFHKIFKMIDAEMKALPTQDRYKFTVQYKIDLSLCLFKKASWRFKELHKAFKRANDPVNYLESKKEDFFMSFKISCQGATSITTFVDFLWHKLSPAVSTTIRNNMAPKIAGDMRANHPAFRGNRSNLEKHILISLAEEENFDKYWQYLHHPQSFFRDYIKQHSSRYCSDKSETIKTFLKISLDDIKNVILSAIQQSSKIAHDKSSTASEWLDFFCDQLGNNLIFPRKDLVGIEHQEIKDIEFLKATMSAALEPTMKGVEQDFLRMSLKDIVPEIEKLLSEHFRGCWKQCPFCGAICTNTIPSHEGEHSVPFHRPQAIGGFKWHLTNQFVIDFCTSLVASDISFRLSDDRRVPYKTYRQAGGDYATWSITPDSSTQPYWKWFVCHFRSKVEEKYQQKFEDRGKIPDAWYKITKQDVLEDLNQK